MEVLSKVVLLSSNHVMPAILEGVTVGHLVPTTSVEGGDEWLRFGKPKDLYFINNDEINVGDWFYHEEFDLIGILEKGENPKESNIKKIVASSDLDLRLPKPSDTFIEKYCQSNGKIKEVYIDYALQGYYADDNVTFIETGRRLSTAFNYEAIIIIPEPVTYTREQVEILLKRAFGTAKSTGCTLDKDQVNGWIKQTLNENGR